ncbi:MAG: hypothetical protein VXA88_09610 [Rhodospirillales bacterium]
MSDYRHRLVKSGGASSQTFSYEDGKGYRGYHFDTEKAKAHVKYKEDQSQYFKKDWKYVGSIPMELVVKYQSTLPEEERADFWHRFATDKQVKQVFLTWLKKNYPELLPGHSK